jgi:hypothetical protein
MCFNLKYLKIKSKHIKVQISKGHNVEWLFTSQDKLCCKILHCREADTALELQKPDIQEHHECFFFHSSAYHRKSSSQKFSFKSHSFALDCLNASNISFFQTKEFARQGFVQLVH